LGEDLVVKLSEKFKDVKNMEGLDKLMQYDTDFTVGINEVSKVLANEISEKIMDLYSGSVEKQRKYKPTLSFGGWKQCLNSLLRN